jgi:hypothetical protein
MTKPSVYVWSNQFPKYPERMEAMNLPRNVYNALKGAEKLSLIPIN